MATNKTFIIVSFKILHVQHYSNRLIELLKRGSLGLLGLFFLVGESETEPWRMGVGGGWGLG